ncbi:hypothetical protein J7T55_009667 [Diaporthe amygdali]|uniref:uncharacterized protein n=1 Tax=Phomopsis amygdali TaxID=1214568 RepID=UPI0022FDBA4B|nr:uncharacterized protein J7T55_009667 [Diaporthe amygdali]KAJ0104003.1 hypothetical protein J7T55_009667 [Diaporthe amygdali]
MADLVKRHTAQHEARAVRNSDSVRAASSNPGRRVVQACKACLRKGVTCEVDDTIPYMSSSIDLDGDSVQISDATEIGSERDDSIVVHQVDSRLRGSNTKFITPISEQATRHPDSTIARTAQNQQTYVEDDSVRSLEDVSSTGVGTGTMGSQDYAERTIESGLHDLPQEYGASTRSYGEVLRDILGSSAATPVDLEDVMMGETGDNIWDQCLDSGQPFADLTEFSFIDLAPFDMEQTLPMTLGRPARTDGQENTASFEQAASAAATQAFQLSGWNWGPSPEDSESAETTNLILPPGDPRPEGVDPHFIPQHSALLGATHRNRLLSMLLNHCEKKQWVQIASTFPSEQFLNQLLQVFFALQGRDTLSWFHLPTVHMKNLRVECLTAMVGAAACFSLNRSVQRFGYVLPEMVRFAVIDQWCRDNSTSRDLQLLNSMLTATTLQSWSGNKRQAEIGEGNSQTVITIIRRSRWLRKDHYRAVYPMSDDQGADLDRKWRLWVDQESKKRIEATLYTLYGLWALVWEQQQFQDTMQSGDAISEDEIHDMPNLMLPSRREPLLKALNALRVRLSSIQGEDERSSTAEPMLVLEYLSMALHVPLQGLHAFAGRDGEREARRIYPLLQEWVQSREARQGIWHAGQVFSAAKAHSSRDMRDLRVMLVYQASITLWVYGVIKKASRGPSRSLHTEEFGPDSIVWLDGEEKRAAVRKFIAIAEGVPALRDVVDGLGEGPICLVENASSTMEAAIHILQRPLDDKDGAQLPLVESVTKLMSEIAKVANIL